MIVYRFLRIFSPLEKQGTNIKTSVISYIADFSDGVCCE